MANTRHHSNDRPMEIETLNTHALISWRAIVAGRLIAMFTMTGLIGLGLAFGGINMDQETTAKSAGMFTGIWFIASALVSLFIGSYFAARISKFRTGRVGSAQGIVIASLFLGFFLYQSISAIGALGSGAGAMLGKSGGAIASGVQKAADNPAISGAVSNMTEDALGDLTLKSSPPEVAQGLGTRLLRGDTEGAKNYLAMQAGISPAEANTRIDQLKGKTDQVMADAKEATATALKSTGWSLFLLVVLGALSSVGGGALGSVANFRKPLVSTREDYVPSGFHA